LLRIYKLILIEDTDMTVINTNVAATVTAAAMKSNQRSMETTMERLATGLRVNSAQDDAAGLAIGTKMDSQIRGFGQAVRNANDGISMLQTADGAAEQITGLLQRMRELSVQGQNDTNSTSDLANLNEEFVALATEIERIADDTQFNGINLLNSNVSKTITIGADEADTISLTFGDFQLESGASETKGVDKVSITQAQLRLLSTNAASAITFTDSAGLSVTIDQTKIGATAANNFSDATLANLATALNSAIDVASNGFSQVDALDTGDDTGISFTQEVAGSGSITSASTNTAGVVATRTVAKTTIGDAGAAASPMAANLTSFDASGSHVQTAGTIVKLDNAIQGVNTARASFGSNISRLSFTVDNLNVAITNTSAAKSAVMDADYAAETTELARTQIIAQAATAMLSQANQQQQSVLALLK
jgi:flagellin